MEIMILGNAAIKTGIICGIASIIALNKEMPACKSNGMLDITVVIMPSIIVGI